MPATATLLERRLDREQLAIIQRRLASILHRQQISTLGVSEKLAASIDRAIDRVLLGVQRGLGIDNGGAQNFQRLQKLAGPLWPRISEILAGQLPEVANWSYRKNADILLSTVPRDWWRVAQPKLIVPGTSRAAGIGGPPPRVPGAAAAAGGDGRRAGPLAIEIEHEPVLRSKDRLSDAEWRAIAEKVIFPPPSREQVNDWVYAPTRESSPDGLTKTGPTANWEQRLGRWSKQIAEPDRLASTLARGISEGQNIQQLTKALRGEFDLARSTAKRIARTEARRVAHLAQQKSFESLGDLMAGEQINAQMDQNTRPHHASRNGVIYWMAPDRKPHHSEIPDLPDEPNCRCWTAPVLAEPDDLAGNPELAAELMNAGKDAIPDASSYTRWFDSASEGARKAAVGSKLYKAMAARVGGKPEWADFLRPDGQLMKAADAVAETPEQRAERKGQVSVMLTQREIQFRQVAATGFER